MEQRMADSGCNGKRMARPFFLSIPCCDASGLQGTLAYAGIVQVDEEASSMRPYETSRLPLVYYEKGYDFRKVRLSSRPIPIPADTQSWTVLDVI
jgi:hypothetical protein